MSKTNLFALSVLVIASQAVGDEFKIQRCEILPLPNQQVAMLIDGVEKLRWNFSNNHPRPFFYPFNGPSGTSLTRMGHPGAQNHDHHLSVWFAHHKVNGVSYWADSSKARIRQKHWYRYKDGDEEAVMASVLGWYDEDGMETLEQDVVAALRPLPDGEHALEIQITFRPATGQESVTLEQTNFGLLAVRVSKTVSAYFGGGRISSSEGGVGEKEIFGKAARWMDYSGPVVTGQAETRHVVEEGITYFDHPDNPHYPTHWHVRKDGWMGASFGMNEDWRITRDEPLQLRYLLHCHRNGYSADKANVVHEGFAKRRKFVVRPPVKGESHRQFEVERAKSGRATVSPN